jgi:y4mF family transcriptional regulator
LKSGKWLPRLRPSGINIALEAFTFLAYVPERERMTMTTSSPATGRSAIELARAAARRGEARPPNRPPLAAGREAADRLPQGRPDTKSKTFYESLLSAEGLTALDALRDPGEALQPAVKLSDLKKRSMLANLMRENADVDVAPQTPPQGSFAQDTDVRPARGSDIDVIPVASAQMLGAVIRRAREERGLSQLKLADLAGVGRRFVSELENGKSSLEFDKVLQVAAAAGVSLTARGEP